MNPWWMVGLGLVAMMLIMAFLWGLQRRTGNAGIVDIAWGMGVGLLAVGFAIGSDDGNVARRWLVGGLALAWAVRLSGHILVRTLRMPEDGRYQELKRKWGVSAQRQLFVFFQLQAVASVLFALPMLIAARSSSPLGMLDFLGVAIWVVAIGGEMIADRQLSAFRSQPESQGRVCRRGLWRYSRHPNYFFEWLHWWSYVCFAAAAPYGWITLLGPLAMLYFILFVTGIPPTEAQAIKSRGEAYREYQRTTSPFIPWPPKTEQST